MSGPGMDNMNPQVPDPEHVLRPVSQVWRRVHVHSARKEGHGVLRIEGQSIHPEWQFERGQCRGDIFRPDDPCFWQRRCL